HRQAHGRPRARGLLHDRRRPERAARPAQEVVRPRGRRLARHAPAAPARAPRGARPTAALRLLTRFDTSDLLSDRVQAGRFDLVLCRNVVIYFTEPVRDALHHRLIESLPPCGYLTVG